MSRNLEVQLEVGWFVVQGISLGPPLFWSPLKVEFQISYLELGIWNSEFELSRTTTFSELTGSEVQVPLPPPPSAPRPTTISAPRSSPGIFDATRPQKPV